MSTWTNKPGILTLVARLQTIVLRLERLDMKKRLDRHTALLNARRAMAEKPRG